MTHRGIRRYFMASPEAVTPVVQTGALATGGEILVLDMGEPISIDEFARKVIRLSGLEPDTDVPVIHVGLRPGEKLDEDLVGSGEHADAIGQPRIYEVPINDAPLADRDETSHF